MMRVLQARDNLDIDRASVEVKNRWLFRVCAVINWTVSIRGIFDPLGYMVAFGGVEPEYAFIFRLWSGFIFMFGCMFWEVSRDVERKAALVKYNWIEKTITALAVSSGYLLSDVPTKMMIVITLTNWAWIPVLLYYDLRLRTVLSERAG